MKREAGRTPLDELPPDEGDEDGMIDRGLVSEERFWASVPSELVVPGLTEGEGFVGPTTAVSKPASSSRTRISSASTRERRVLTSSPQVLLSLS